MQLLTVLFLAGLSLGSLSSANQLNANALSRVQKLFKRSESKVKQFSRRLRAYKTTPIFDDPSLEGESGRGLLTGAQLGTLSGGAGAYMGLSSDEEEENQLNLLKENNARKSFKLMIKKNERNNAMRNLDSLIRQMENRVNDLEASLTQKVSEAQSYSFPVGTPKPFGSIFDDPALVNEDIRTTSLGGIASASSSTQKLIEDSLFGPETPKLPF